MNSFTLPKDGIIYSDKIFTRCRDLIGYHLWSGLRLARLDAWIANFRTAEEQYFAAKILDGLIFRSKDQTISMLRHLLCRVVPDYARIATLPAALYDIYTTSRNPYSDPHVRLVPVIPPESPPTKSGPIIARYLKRDLRINEEWIIHPASISGHVSSADAFVFVDDFLGTGDQFVEFFSALDLCADVPQLFFIYACLAGHEEGIRRLRNMFPHLHIVAVEHLNANQSILSAEGGLFPDEINSINDARDFYFNLLDSHGIKIDGPNRRGYGCLDIAYAFDHAVPDNSLPILWWDKSEMWQPLFDR